MLKVGSEQAAYSALLNFLATCKLILVLLQPERES